MKFEKPLVEIKGFGGKLGLFIDSTALFDQVEDELRKLLQRPNLRQFFKGAEIILQDNSRCLNTNEFYRLKRILKYEGDLHLISESTEGIPQSAQNVSHATDMLTDSSSSFEGNPEIAWFSPPQSETELQKETVGVPESLQSTAPMNKTDMSHSFSAERPLSSNFLEKAVQDDPKDALLESPTESLFPIKGYKTTDALIVRQTLHSGQAFRSQNGVILLGDMNAGAEIISDHDVIVLGTLRGTVHAGASGNRKALVFALRMQPTQLRIAELITQPSQEDKRSPRFEPEIAFIEGESIIIETCQKIRV